METKTADGTNICFNVYNCVFPDNACCTVFGNQQLEIILWSEYINCILRTIVNDDEKDLKVVTLGPVRQQ